MTERKLQPQLRFPGFEGQWEEKKLEEIAKSITSGKTKPNDEGTCSVYGSMGIIGYCDIPTHNGKYLLVARVGANAGSIKRVEGQFSVTDNTLILDIKEIVVINYLYYLLFSYNLNKLVFGSGQPLVTAGQLKSLILFFPIYEEQQKIASFLTTVDKRITLLTQKKEKLEQYKKGVMQKIFNREIRFKDENGNDYPNWEDRFLGNVLEQVVRKIQKPKKSYWRLGLRSHAKGTFHEFVKDPSKVMMEELYEVKENDLIVNITFAWEHAIAIANEQDEGKLVSHRFPTYTFKSQQHPLFFKYLVSRDSFKRYLSNISPGGAGRNRVMNKKDFLKIVVFIPSLPEQQKIATFLSAIDKQIEGVSKQIDVMKEWKKGLLQQMFV